MILLLIFFLALLCGFIIVSMSRLDAPSLSAPVFRYINEILTCPHISPRLIIIGLIYAYTFACRTMLSLSPAA